MKFFKLLVFLYGFKWQDKNIYKVLRENNDNFLDIPSWETKINRKFRPF